MMLNRSILVSFVVIFSISWVQSSTIYIFHRNYESLYPYLLDYDNEPMDLDEDNGPMPARYETMICKLHDYVTSPRDEYIDVLSRLQFTFGLYPHYDELDKPYAFLKEYSVKSILKNPAERNKFAVAIINLALKRLNESCQELEKTINPYIVNEELTPLQNASGLSSEEKQHDIKIILIQVQSAKLVLQDLQTRVDFYVENGFNSTYVAKQVGLSLRGLLSYTVSAMTSIRGSWIDWKIMSYYSKTA